MTNSDSSPSTKSHPPEFTRRFEEPWEHNTVDDVVEQLATELATGPPDYLGVADLNVSDIEREVEYRLTVIIDTSVLLSAVGWGEGNQPLDCFLLIFSEQVEVVTSPDTIGELARKLRELSEDDEGYPKFSKSDEKQRKIERTLLNQSSVVDPNIDLNQLDSTQYPNLPEEAQRDTDDDMFLEIAYEINADYLVANDSYLCDTVCSFNGVDILKPVAFIEDLGWWN